LVRPERIVDQRLISLSGAYCSHPEALKHFIIEVNRNSRFADYSSPWLRLETSCAFAREEPSDRVGRLVLRRLR
jgi:hypothetical protein